MDVVVVEGSENIIVMYHSDNNSFHIADTGIKFREVSTVRKELIEELDEYDIGHCF